MKTWRIAAAALLMLVAEKLLKGEAAVRASKPKHPRRRAEDWN